MPRLLQPSAIALSVCSPQSSCLVELLGGCLLLRLGLFHPGSIASRHWVLLCVLLQLLLDDQIHAVFVHIARQRFTLVGFALSSRFLSHDDAGGKEGRVISWGGGRPDTNNSSERNGTRTQKKKKNKNYKKEKNVQSSSQAAKYSHTPRGARLLVAA